MNPKVVQHSSSIIERIQVEKILAMKESQKALTERLRLIETALDEAELELVIQIDAGADLSQAGYALSVSQSERRYPKWKEEFISVAGKTAADDILEATPATIYRRLVVK